MISVQEAEEDRIDKYMEKPMITAHQAKNNVDKYWKYNKIYQIKKIFNKIESESNLGLNTLYLYVDKNNYLIQYTALKISDILDKLKDAGFQIEKIENCQDEAFYPLMPSSTQTLYIIGW